MSVSPIFNGFPISSSLSTGSSTSSAASSTSGTSSTATTPSAASNSNSTLLSTIAATPAIASSTAPNWLAEAQSAILSSASSGGMMGALQSASLDNQPGSINSFLTQSQDEANAMASIMQNSVQNEGQLYSQIAQQEGQQAAEDRQARENALLNPPAQTNFTPDAQLDPVIYFPDGSSIDTGSNIMTLANGNQIDTATGLAYVDPSSVIQMANGAYLDTKNNILHEAGGEQVDATTGLIISTTA